jgi:hypothetical protein
MNGRRARVFGIGAIVLVLILGSATPVVHGQGSMPVGEIVRTQQIVRPGPPHIIVTSTLTMPLDATWHTEFTHGPLRLTVLQGAVSVQLVDTEARIERHATPLIPAHHAQLPPGRAAILMPGGRLVAPGTDRLTVTHAGHEESVALVTQLH